jgi:predicted dinucleotide-binding enzyme
LQLIPQLGNLEGKTLIDATNSVRTKPEPYPTAYHAIKSLTKLETVVKCFNTTGFENMLNPLYKGEGIYMFCAGNNKPSKKIAEQLAIDIGFASCYDFGGDDKVELLEKFALSWINLAIMQGQGRDIAFKIVRR